MLVVADFQGTVTATNTLTISRAGADTINGGTQVVITSANGAYALWSDGVSKWSAQALGSAAGVTSLGGLSGVIDDPKRLRSRSGILAGLSLARVSSPSGTFSSNFDFSNIIFPLGNMGS
jgi:hypothetical protein